MNPKKILEFKSTITQLKNLLEGLTNRSWEKNKSANMKIDWQRSYNLRTKWKKNEEIFLPVSLAQFSLECTGNLEPYSWESWPWSLPGIPGHPAQFTWWDPLICKHLPEWNWIYHDLFTMSSSSWLLLLCSQIYNSPSSSVSFIQCYCYWEVI